MAQINTPGRIAPSGWRSEEEPSFGTMFKRSLGSGLGNAVARLPGDLVNAGVGYWLDEKGKTNQFGRDLDLAIGKDANTGIGTINKEIAEVNARRALAERKGEYGGASAGEKVATPAPRIGAPVPGQPTVRVRRAPPTAADTVFGEGVLDAALAKMPRMGGGAGPTIGAQASPQPAQGGSPAVPAAPDGMRMTRLKLAVKEPAIGATVANEQEFIDKTRQPIPGMSDAVDAGARASKGASNTVEDLRIGADRSMRDLAKETEDISPISIAEVMRSDMSPQEKVRRLVELRDRAQSRPGWRRQKALADAPGIGAADAEKWAKIAADEALATQRGYAGVEDAQRNAIGSRDRMWEMAAKYEADMDRPRKGGGGGGGAKLSRKELRDDAIANAAEVQRIDGLLNARRKEIGDRALKLATERFGPDPSKEMVAAVVAEVKALDSNYANLTEQRARLQGTGEGYQRESVKRWGANMNVPGIAPIGFKEGQATIGRKGAEQQFGKPLEQQARELEAKIADIEAKTTSTNKMTGAVVQEPNAGLDALRADLRELKAQIAARRQGIGR